MFSRNFMGRPFSVHSLFSSCSTFVAAHSVNLFVFVHNALHRHCERKGVQLVFLITPQADLTRLERRVVPKLLRATKCA